jgi:hypothetical protein
MAKYLNIDNMYYLSKRFMEVYEQTAWPKSYIKDLSQRIRRLADQNKAERK